MHIRRIRKLITAGVLIGFPAALAGGCSPSVSGSVPTVPTASTAQSSQSTSTEPIGSSPTAKTAQWLQFGYDPGHSGDNPLEKSIGAKNVSNLQIAWNDQSLIQPGGIVVDHNVAYVDDMGQSNAGLYAFDATTGAQKWYANVNLNGSWGSFTHAVAAVAGNIVVSPCSNGTAAYFLTGMCGINAKNGKMLWETYCEPYQGSPCGGLVNGGTSPALYNNLIYFQSTQGVNEQPDTQALDPKTGAIVWDVAGVYHCPDAGDTSYDPLPAADGLVFAVLGCQGQNGGTEICGLSASAGTAAWCDQSPTAYIENLIADNNKLYVAEPGSSNLVVVALDARTGAQSWQATIPGSNYQGMATANGRLFIEDGGAGLYALSATKGKQLWSYTANGNILQGGVVSVANGIVYTDGGGGNNGNVAIAAFNEKSGSLIWTSGSVGNGGAPATPAIVNGTVYTGCYTLCAFTLPTTKQRSSLPKRW